MSVKINIYFSIVFLSLIHFLSGSSEILPNTISKIEIKGNQLTKDYIILREIHHPMNVPFDSVLATEDRDRIDNLGIFSDVKFYLQENGDDTSTLVYVVIEAWRIFPIPIIQYEEETGWSFGGVGLIKNFRGKKQEIAIFSAGSESSSFKGIVFKDPWITGDHISLEIEAIGFFLEHPYRQYDFTVRKLELKIGKYFGYQKKLWITPHYKNRNVNELSNEPDLNHKHFIADIEFHYDVRDLYINPSKGMISKFRISSEYGLTSDSPNNLTLFNQTSYYRTVIPGRRIWIAGTSFSIQKWFGPDIIYQEKVMGSRKNVRGWTIPDHVSILDEEFRTGFNFFHASVELRQTVIPKFITRFGTEFGMILVEFLDVGMADDNFIDLWDKSPIFGAGFGVRIFMPGAQLLRLDYAWGFYEGKFRPPELHFDIGHKF